MSQRQSGLAGWVAAVAGRTGRPSDSGGSELPVIFCSTIGRQVTANPETREATALSLTFGRNNSQVSTAKQAVVHGYGQLTDPEPDD